MNPLAIIPEFYILKECLTANDHFLSLHCADKVTEDSPECLRRPKKASAEVYLAAWGPNEYNPTGSLSNWEYQDKIGSITQPALIISGTDDLCTPLVAKTMYDLIPDSQWELFEGCKHTCFVEHYDRYCLLLDSWIKKYD